MATLTYTGTLEVTTCWCGIAHAIPADLMRQARDKGKGVYCPLGHTWVVKETRADQLARELEEQRQATVRAQNSARATRDLLRHEERSHAATKGHQTRLRKRIAAGVCPCCGRTFSQLERHMASQHPGYGKADAS